MTRICGRSIARHRRRSTLSLRRAARNGRGLGLRPASASRSAPPGMDQVYRPETADDGGDARGRPAPAAVARRRARDPALRRASRPSTTSRWRSRRARSWRWSAIPARASRRFSASSPGSSRSTRDGSRSAAARWRRLRGGVPPEKRGVGMMFQDYALFPHLTRAPERDVRPPRDARGARRGRSRSGRCRGSALPAAPTTIRTCCPAASSSGSRWRGRWRRGRASCSWTSPSRTSTGGRAILVREDTFAVLRESGTTGDPRHPRPGRRHADGRPHPDDAGAAASSRAAPAEELCRKPATLAGRALLRRVERGRRHCRAGSVATPAGDFPAPVAPGWRGRGRLHPADGDPLRRRPAAPGRIVVAAFPRRDRDDPPRRPRARPAAPRGGRAGQRPRTSGRAVSFTVEPEDVLVFPAG